MCWLWSICTSTKMNDMKKSYQPPKIESESLFDGFAQFPCSYQPQCTGQPPCINIKENIIYNDVERVTIKKESEADDGFRNSLC